MVDLDNPMVNVAPIQSENLLPPAKAPHRAYPSEPSKRPSNLVLDEDYTWKTFKGIITNNKVNSCYNMSVRDFECSAIHDFFKVYNFHSLLFYFHQV